MSPAETPTKTPAETADTAGGILVLCTGNSCRSQMAEGFLRRHLRARGDATPVESAGSEPADRVHPLAVEVMDEVGIDLEDAEPQHLDRYFDKVPIRTVIIVCDGAAANCPTWPGAAERLVWPFDDPAAFKGDREAKLEEFRRVRDQIEARIVAWLETGGPA